MALCTNPPMPLVGDGARVGDDRPDGDFMSSSNEGVSSAAGPSNRGGGLKGRGDASLPWLDVLVLDAEGVLSRELSADMPGS